MQTAVRHTFEKGPEHWCSYDYHAGMIADGRNIFVLATHSASGGDEPPYVWSDHRQWSTDTPERPVSILALLYYRSWAGADPIDLTGARVSFYLKGESLELSGARCFFWIHGQHSRWHLTSQPLDVPEGSWNAEPSELDLEPDPSLWHQSWAKDRAVAPSLPELLSQVESYGFSFAGFSSEPTGRFCLREFSIAVQA